MIYEIKLHLQSNEYVIFNIMNDFCFLFGFFRYSFPFCHFVAMLSDAGEFREFRIVLHEDPSSIFAPNVHIENTVGPIHYDVSRIYSGMLEGKTHKKIKRICLIQIKSRLRVYLCSILLCSNCVCACVRETERERKNDVC